MNVLRFPIQLRTGKNQFMRAERLKEREENERMLDDTKTEPSENETTSVSRFCNELKEKIDTREKFVPRK